jgi:hypothetical protein
MSTNIYVYRETVWYSNKPSDRWGWYLSTSSEGIGVTWFKSRAGQKRFVNLVRRMVDNKFGKSPYNYPGYRDEWETMLTICYIDGPEQTWIVDALISGLPTDRSNFLRSLSIDPMIKQLFGDVT